MLRRCAAGGKSLAAFGLALLTAAPAMAAPDAAVMLKGLAACQRIAPSDSRLSCFDDLAHRSLGSALAPAQLAPPQAPYASLAQPAPAANLASPAAPQSPAETARSLLTAKSDQLTLIIAKVDTGRDNALRLTTTDGTVLEQTDDENNFSKYPAVGDSVTVFHRMLGYRCLINKRDYFICRLGK